MQPFKLNLLYSYFILAVIYIIIPLFSCDEISAQTSKLILHPEGKKMNLDSLPTINGSQDTLLHYSFPPIEIEGESTLESKRQKHKYHQLYTDIKRIYPLAIIVSDEVKKVNTEMDSVYRSKSQRKEYLKWYEKHIYHTYIDTLISLNNRQTRLFIKLIKRETGSTPYELIKKYRGGWDALFWQLSANVLLLNLKNDYDPVEDYMIEDIMTKFY